MGLGVEDLGFVVGAIAGDVACRVTGSFWARLERRGGEARYLASRYARCMVRLRSTEYVNVLIVH